MGEAYLISSNPLSVITKPELFSISGSGQENDTTHTHKCSFVPDYLLVTLSSFSDCSRYPDQSLNEGWAVGVQRKLIVPFSEIQTMYLYAGNGFRSSTYISCDSTGLVSVRSDNSSSSQASYQYGSFTFDFEAYKN